MNPKIIKSLMVASIACFFTVVVIDNIIDYQTNWEFVKHVTSMDTIFLHSVLKSRAITDPAVQKTLYCIIIVTEALTGILCWFGAVLMLVNFRDSNKYSKHKSIAITGLSLGFFLYMLGFIVIGGEWFAMWQSKTWSGQQTAGMFITIIMLVIIFVGSNENETA